MYGVRLLISASIGLLTGSGVKLTPELGYFENCALEVWMFVYGKSTNNTVLEDALTPEPGPSMNSVLLRWTPYLNIHSKLKGHSKTINLDMTHPWNPA